ncbi:MAG: hypothetical protein H9535_20800 [Ignavibacteria bacterium]|nr:hypothetical protein [Ignavibacteria bacterium]
MAISLLLGISQIITEFLEAELHVFGVLLRVSPPSPQPLVAPEQASSSPEAASQAQPP